ncbi:Bromodomain adjacent to zinc finger domain protein 2B [Manis javanica]|nr:Bromodomain adjacent to zinc finger domain protein 2B [Manis javanica]
MTLKSVNSSIQCEPEQCVALLFYFTKKPKQDDSKDLTLCRMILTDMATRLSTDARKAEMEENACGDLSKQPTFTSLKKPKREDSKDPDLSRCPALGRLGVKTVGIVAFC